MDMNAISKEIAAIDERLDVIRPLETEAWILRERRARLQGALIGIRETTKTISDEATKDLDEVAHK